MLLLFLIKLLSSVTYFFVVFIIECKSFRASQDIFVILPSLHEVQNAVSIAKAWLKNSEPFMASAFPVASASSLLRLQVLKVSVIFLLFISSDPSCFVLNVVYLLKSWWSTNMTS